MDKPSVLTYPVKTVTENAMFWKTLFRAEIFENAIFVFSNGQCETFENDDVTVSDLVPDTSVLLSPCLSFLDGPFFTTILRYAK